MELSLYIKKRASGAGPLKVRSSRPTVVGEGSPAEREPKTRSFGVNGRAIARRFTPGLPRLRKYPSQYHSKTADPNPKEVGS